MASSGSGTDGAVGMADVLQALKTIQESQSRLATEVESVSHRLDAITPSVQVPSSGLTKEALSALAVVPSSPVQTALTGNDPDPDSTSVSGEVVQAQKAGFTSRIILT